MNKRRRKKICRNEKKRKSECSPGPNCWYIRYVHVKYTGTLVEKRVPFHFGHPYQWNYPLGARPEMACVYIYKIQKKKRILDREGGLEVEERKWGMIEWNKKKRKGVRARVHWQNSHTLNFFSFFVQGVIHAHCILQLKWQFVSTCKL